MNHCELVGVLISTSAKRFGVMREFYVEILGLEPRSDRDGFVNFELGTARLSVAVHSEISGVASQSARILINLAVADIDAEYRRLRGLGVGFERPPELEKWGGLVATLSDPDGNLIQLFQMP